MDLLQYEQEYHKDVQDIVPKYESNEDLPSITVQVVLKHPNSDSVVYWVLNKKEVDKREDSPTLKPSGWGNPGGGLEQKDRLSRASPEAAIHACGRRELIDETGFINFTFEETIQPLYYTHKSGHQVITLAAILQNLHNIPIKEHEEIECGQWIDLHQSPSYFFDSDGDMPYWSHVRNTIIVLNRLAYVYNLPTIRVHPIWKLVFNVGAGNPRFPLYGFHIKDSHTWRQEFRHHIQKDAKEINLDHIYEVFGEQIKELKEKERGLISQRAYTERATLQDLRRLAQYKEELRQEEDKWRKFAEEE